MAEGNCAVSKQGFLKLCRICLKEDLTDSKLLFTDNNESKQILETIYLCSHVILISKEWMPKYICKKCLYALNISNEFRLKCIAADNILSSFRFVTPKQPYDKKNNIDIDELDIRVKSEITFDDNNSINANSYINVELPKSSDELDRRVKPEITFDDNYLNVALPKSSDDLDLGVKSVIIFNENNDNYHLNVDLPKLDENHEIIDHSNNINLKVNTKCSDFSHNQMSVDSVSNVQSNIENIIERPIDIKSEVSKCEICGKVLKTHKSLLNHIVAMHEKRKYIGNVVGCGSERAFHCIKCSYTTKYSQTLVNHMRTHTGEKPYQCKCGKQFSQLGGLLTHKKSHSEVTYYTCTLCGKQFKYKDTFKNHQRVHETGSFECNTCEKKLKSRQALKAHLYRHLEVRNFSCDVCGSTFVTHSELLNHKKRHNRNKCFKCHICNYRTYRKKALADHIKRHTGERLFKCDRCDATFCTAGELRNHQRRHTKEKPYSCTICRQRFVYSSSLNKHVRSIHQVKYTWNDTIDRTTVKPVLDLSKK